MGTKSSLILILGAGVITGIVFAVGADLDLRFAALFYDGERQLWPYEHDALLQTLRAVNKHLTVLVSAVAVAALAMRTFRLRIAGLMPATIAVFLLSTLALGPGLLTNLLLKGYWGRPRPEEVTQFGGPLDFVAWWNPFGRCDANCSFVSGEAASAFWLLAVASILPARFRPVAVVAALAFGLAVGLARMAMGGHFASDVLFAGVLNALVIWAMYGLIFTWGQRRRPLFAQPFDAAQPR
jgi:membrane-associated PAP2 superfamily phosphatase